MLVAKNVQELSERVAKGGYPVFSWDQVKLAAFAGGKNGIPSDWESFKLAISGHLASWILIKKITPPSAQKVVDVFTEMHERLVNPIPIPVMRQMYEHAWRAIVRQGMLEQPDSLEGIFGSIMSNQTIWEPSFYLSTNRNFFGVDDASHRDSQQTVPKETRGEKRKRLLEENSRQPRAQNRQTPKATAPKAPPATPEWSKKKQKKWAAYERVLGEGGDVSGFSEFLKSVGHTPSKANSGKGNGKGGKQKAKGKGKGKGNQRDTGGWGSGYAPKY